ncbi:MAG TPA: protein translocase subunit SecD [Ignavibacteriaceae bacterium]|nr:protein translocase subunit SecD [Ignavibacteriaceae bacterium]
MKELRFRFILIVLAIALSIYLLYPTYVDYQNSKDIGKVIQAKRAELLTNNPSISEDQLEKVLLSIEDSIKLADPSIREARLKRVKLGLDLQGGMRVVLEVNTAKLLEKIANNPDDIFREILESASKEAVLSDEPIVDIFARKLSEKGIRLSRYFGSIREDDSEILSNLKTQTDDAVTRAMEIIRNRVDQYGVSEPSIQKQGERRVIIELPGIAKEEEARQLLQGTALLEFKLLKDPEFTINVMKKIDETLAGKLADENDTTSTTKDSASTVDTSSNKQLSAEEFAKEHPFFAVALINPQSQTADAYVKADDKAKIQRMLSRPDVQNVIPNNVEFAFSAKPIGVQDGQDIFVLYLVNKAAELTGGVITNAMANIDPNTSAAIVSMEMNSEGATEWARITGANIDKRCAIMLDGVIFSAPVIRGKIPGGRSQIEGMANLEEAKLLEIVLKAGALPAPVEIIEERTVGPSLGQDSISKGLNSAILGYILVAVFMVIYYQKAGTVAAAALTFTILFILGVLAGFGATLTLPGIAGVVLTMGMAVDANVLIYERIREELSTGKTVKAAIDGGFSKAYSAIFDSNITTFFTGIILYQFGSGPVQGFALTLMIGIVASLFSALVIGRLLFDFMVVKGQKISLG